MGRAPCCSKVGLHRGAWSDEEDKLLTQYIQAHGEGQWRSMPSKAGLLRCGKSCRLRWMNYLRPGIKRGNFTAEEDEAIIRLHSIHGSRWSFIASQLSGRTDNEIKNYWNSHLKRRLAKANSENELHNHPEGSKKIKKLRRRKTNQKSTKVKTLKKKELVSTQSASSSSQLPSSESESLNPDKGLMSGALSSSTIDQGEEDFLATHFWWPDWSPLLEIEGASSMNELDTPLNGFDFLMMKHDESELLEKIYDECLLLIQDDGHAL